MQRINSSTAREHINGLNKNGFHDNYDLSGQDATYLTPEWCNTIQEELCNLIEKNGYSLDLESREQLYNILATNDKLLALSEEIEKKLATFATKTALKQAIDYDSANLQKHKDAKNPHPQYLLATTFGVDLAMTANIQTTPIDSGHRVYGWNGEGGDVDFDIGGIRWWNSSSGTFTFKPWRSYGQFLLYFDFQPQGDGHVYVKTFSSDGNLLSDKQVASFHHAGYDFRETPIKHVFELPQGGYAEIIYDLSVWNKSYGGGRGSIYVDDRPKSFSPVGYTSTVNSSNQSGVVMQVQDDGYSIYPNYEWFYYSDGNKQYNELNSLSTFDNPAQSVPHYYRAKFEQVRDTNLWCIVEVGKQLTSDKNDYTMINRQIVRASVDSLGDTVLGIPFEMRDASTPNNETLVYKVAFYNTDITSSSDKNFPDGSLNGTRLIYIRL